MWRRGRDVLPRHHVQHWEGLSIVCHRFVKPVGRARTAAVGELMDVVVFLFFLCSDVSHLADPSSTLNLKGLLLGDLAPRAVFWVALDARFEKTQHP